MVLQYVHLTTDIEDIKYVFLEKSHDQESYQQHNPNGHKKKTLPMYIVLKLKPNDKDIYNISHIEYLFHIKVKIEPP